MDQRLGMVHTASDGFDTLFNEHGRARGTLPGVGIHLGHFGTLSIPQTILARRLVKHPIGRAQPAPISMTSRRHEDITKLSWI